MNVDSSIENSSSGVTKESAKSWSASAENFGTLTTLAMGIHCAQTWQFRHVFRLSKDLRFVFWRKSKERSTEIPCVRYKSP